MTRRSPRAAVAAGHRLTVEAAGEVLAAGGNAFDALIAALWTACVVEPVLCSPGGGGFLMARPEGRAPAVLDFFVQTPRRPRPPEELDFFEVIADFGTDQQAFHIGLGSIATPGFVRGLFAMQRELASLPMRELVAPAVQHAREGVALDELQAYIFSIVAPIYLATPEARAVFESPTRPGHTLQAGEILRQPELADTLEVLAIEGDDLFYRGEIAALIEQQCAEGGGHLRREDLERYCEVERQPLVAGLREHRLWTNPPPSSGGILIAFALALLDGLPADWLPGEGPQRALCIARLLGSPTRHASRIMSTAPLPTGPRSTPCSTPSCWRATARSCWTHRRPCAAPPMSVWWTGPATLPPPPSPTARVAAIWSRAPASCSTTCWARRTSTRTASTAGSRTGA